jgi:hypothetical protein
MASPKKQQNFDKVLRDEWEHDASLREEFLDSFDRFRAYKKAEAAGQISYPDVEKKIEALKKHPNRELPAVKTFADYIRNRGAGKKKRGTEGAVKRTVRQFVHDVDDVTFDGLIAAMENEDLVDSICYNPDDPAPMQIDSVDHRYQRVFYNTTAGKEKTVSFSRLRSILSEIKSSL